MFSDAPCSEDEGSSELVVMDDDGGNRRTLISAPALGADWSPDGKQIVYTGQGADQSSSTIWLANADGSNAQTFGPTQRALAVGALLVTRREEDRVRIPDGHL